MKLIFANNVIVESRVEFFKNVHILFRKTKRKVLKGENINSQNYGPKHLQKYFIVIKFLKKHHWQIIQINLNLHGL